MSDKPLKPSKQAKPNRNNRYSVEVTDSIVRVIRIGGNGTILNAAESAVEGLPETVGKEYIDILSKTIKKTARAAKTPISIGLPCAVVTGGPHVIIRRFSWPDMNDSALSINAEQEISAYLPGDPSLFYVHHRVLRRMPKTETTAPTIDVMVAAIPTELASAIISAVNKSGFFSKQLEVRENARGKFAAVFRNNINIEIPAANEDTEENLPEPIEDIPIEDRFDEEGKYGGTSFVSPDSYVILDVLNPQINISLYLDGIFYSNRYFTAQVDENNNYDTDALANEVSSVIDYIQYRERGSVMQCVMMLGEEEDLPGITQSLKDNLDIPIFSTNEWIGQGLTGKKFPENLEIAKFIDAYGAALPSAPGFADINLAPARKLSNSARISIPVAITAVILGAVVFVAIYIPSGYLTLNRLEINSLEKTLNDFLVSAEDMADIQNEIAEVRDLTDKKMDEVDAVQAEIYSINDRIQDVDGFYSEYKQPDTVIPALREVELSSEGQTFDTVSVSPDGLVSISGTARDLKQVADDIVALLESERFINVYSSNLNAGEGANSILNDINLSFDFSRPSDGESSVTFNLTLSLVPRGD